MSIGDQVTPMVPPQEKQLSSRGKHTVVWALLLSSMLHATAYFATPFIIFSWREPAGVRFDATLVELAPETSTSAIAPTTITGATRKPSGPKATKPVRTKRTTPTFVAPENSIALPAANESAEESDKGANIEASDRTETVPKSVDAPDKRENKDLPSLPAIAEPVTQNMAQAVQAISSPAVELPSRISIAYRMTSSISDGVADYTWTRNGQKFEIDSNMRATGFIVGNLVGVLHQVSQGTVMPAGLRPDSFEIRRGESLPDRAEFLHAANELKLIRGNGQIRAVPLSPGLQDMQSFLFQLAYDAPRLRGPDDRLDVMVTNARKVYRHRFQQVGTELLQVGDGTVATIHLRSEAADPEDIYEVWLVPDKHHLPVKLKFFAGRFPVELIATSIRTTP